MSGDEELDKLLFSIPKSSKKKKVSGSKENSEAKESKQPESDESGQDSSFDPLDFVGLKGPERRLVTWLARHPEASFSDIKDAFAIPQEDLEILLAQLLEQKRIKSVERDGEMFYSAHIRGRAGRHLRGFPQDLWKKAGLDDE